MKLDELLEIQDLENSINLGYVISRNHPNYPELIIYNYTHKCQYDKAWTNTTVNCRGLIVNLNSQEVITRPFRKIFNLEELTEAALEENNCTKDGFLVFDKLDGALGVGYQEPSGRFRIATRGSFDSPEANTGNQILDNKYSSFVPASGMTYLFEIISPKHNHIINYGQLEDLILLGGVMLSPTYRLFNPDLLEEWTGPKVKFFGANRWGWQPEPRKNAEGYVLMWKHFQLKIKYEEYKNLHRIKTSLTPINIFELWKTKSEKEIEYFISQLEEEDVKYIKRLIRNFKERFIVLLEINLFTLKTYSLLNKKELAFKLNKFQETGKYNQHIVFSLYDRNLDKVKEAIFKQIEKEI